MRVIVNRPRYGCYSQAPYTSAGQRQLEEHQLGGSSRMTRNTKGDLLIRPSRNVSVC